MDLVAQELSQSVIVPNVVDRQLSVARQALERARLKVGNISPADAPDAGFVTKQSPAAGAKVDQGTSVDLEVKAPICQIPQLESSVAWSNNLILKRSAPPRPSL